MSKPTPPRKLSSKLNIATNLIEENRKALFAGFKAISTLETKLDCIQAKVSEYVQRIAVAESSASLQDECILVLETACAMLTASDAKLLAKVTDLKPCRHQNKIRIMGLLKCIEGSHPAAFFSELLAVFLGLDL